MYVESEYIEPVRWVWPGRIAEGKITLLAGDPGVGKSMIALDVAARLSRGRGFPEPGSDAVEKVERNLAELEARAAMREAENLRRYGTRMDPFGDVRTVREEGGKSLNREIGGAGGVCEEASRMGGGIVGGDVLRAGDGQASAPMESAASTGSGQAGFKGGTGTADAVGGFTTGAALRGVRLVGEGVKGKTLIFSAEDDWRDTVKPRLKAMGADLGMVDEFRSLDSYCSVWQSFSVRNNLEALAHELRVEKDVKLLILDPITACMEGIDQNSTAAIRQHLAPLAHLAARMGVAVLGITHLNKRRRTVDIYRTTGSLAVAAIARAVHFAMPGVDGGPCTLRGMKSNLSAGGATLAYRICEAKAGGVSVVEWLGGVGEEEVKESEEEVFKRHDIEGAKDFLVASLADGPLPGEPLIRQAKRLAISERTLRRAKAALGIKSKKDGLGVWEWVMAGKEGGSR